MTDSLNEKVVEELQLRNNELNDCMDAFLGKIDSTQPNNHLHEHRIATSHLIADNFSLYIEAKEELMDERIIGWVSRKMEQHLSPEQMKILRATLKSAARAQAMEEERDLIALFLSAKEIEGCSQRTIEYYENTLRKFEADISTPLHSTGTDELREYLARYEFERGSSKVTIDNIRRIIASFFSWLEDEDYIVKSPARRIKHVKTPKRIKSTFTDEDLEMLREGCANARDLAIIDMLTSTGMRIGELVGLNINDINLEERECLVTGKGNKQRLTYFDARTKVHLDDYLRTRTDDHNALFIPLNGKARRMTIGAIELRLRQIGKKSNIQRVHPHKFRRTLATNAIDKGMPIEQVQKLLGHEKIDTTMHYALVNQSNVKASHRKYLE